MPALMQVLGTLSHHGPELSSQDEESREEKKDLGQQNKKSIDLKNELSKNKRSWSLFPL